MIEKNKTCLNCKHEPDWSDIIGKNGRYPRRTGKCKYTLKLPPLPKVVEYIIKIIVRYADNSGIITNCKTWEPK